MEMDKIAKDINRLNLLINKLSSGKALGVYDKIDILNKALTESQSLSFSELSGQLEQLLNATQNHIDQLIEQRREMILAESKKAGISAKRFQDYDRIDIFKVSYKGKKVRLEIGSELVEEFDEADGTKVLQKIQEERIKLDSAPFKRERFFQLIQYSCFLAQREAGTGDQWVPIRTVYAYLTLLRNLDSDSFIKNPSLGKYTPYSTAQFVFDLARFGRSNWICENYALKTQTPNMSTVAAKKAVTLPDLQNPDKLGAQFAVLKIVKSDG